MSVTPSRRLALGPGSSSRPEQPGQHGAPTLPLMGHRGIVNGTARVLGFLPVTTQLCDLNSDTLGVLFLGYLWTLKVLVVSIMVAKNTLHNA